MVAPISKVGSQGHSPLPYSSRPARSEVAIVSNSRACPYRARVSAARACRPPPLSSPWRPSLPLWFSPSRTFPAQGLLVTRARCPHDPHHGPPLTDNGPFVTLATSFLIFLPPLPAGCSAPLPPPLLSSTVLVVLASRHRRRSDASWCTSRRQSPLGARIARDTGSRR